MKTNNKFMNGKKAVTAVTYGLISACIIGIALAAIAATGIKINSVFGITGNTIAGTMTLGNNSVLTTEQQQEVQNEQAEIAAGQVSAACINTMLQDATDAATNNASCLGPGYGIVPPPLPVAIQIIGGHTVEVENNGQVYSEYIEGAAGNPTNAGDYTLGFPGNQKSEIWEYNDGYLLEWTDNEIASDCSASPSWYGAPNSQEVSPGNVTLDGSAGGGYSYGVCANSTPFGNYSYNGTGNSSNWLGTGTSW